MVLQGYQWMKDKILSEEGHRQQAKLKELQAVAERLGCTLPQLAIGKTTCVQCSLYWIFVVFTGYLKVPQAQCSNPTVLT